MNQTITTIENGNIPAQFITFGNKFFLVAYHMHKSFNRQEGLAIKNRYNMKPTHDGYIGQVSKSVFLGGKLIYAEEDR